MLEDVISIGRAQGRNGGGRGGSDSGSGQEL